MSGVVLTSIQENEEKEQILRRIFINTQRIAREAGVMSSGTISTVMIIKTHTEASESLLYTCCLLEEMFSRLVQKPYRGVDFNNPIEQAIQAERIEAIVSQPDFDTWIASLPTEIQNALPKKEI